MAKRLFDLVLAVLALAVLAPLLLAAALWVRLDSAGPAVFRQERVGRHGKVFRIHKLRTMRVDAASHGPAVTTAADPRVTAAGRWLRHYRIDELPQLLDVIAGHMSLVGPRPEVPRFVALYPPALREQVLSVRPGLTDPASLEFVDEAAALTSAADAERAYIDDILPRKLRCQAEYAQHASLASDLAVLARSVRVVLARRRVPQ
jgi:lipopolysaccharide/colanic/teichoic acid biosynthesis glycosyltransferase